MTDRTGSAEGVSERPDEAAETPPTPQALLSSLLRANRITPETPLGAAMLWRALLVNGPGQRETLNLLTIGSPANTDHARARRVLPGLALHEFPVLSAGHGDVAYVRFQERNQGPGVLRIRPWYVTLLKGEDGWWRVWSLTADSRPAPEHVLIPNYR
jgi:hypothetical protein